jgi:hypothetical protein
MKIILESLRPSELEKSINLYDCEFTLIEASTIALSAIEGDQLKHPQNIDQYIRDYFSASNENSLKLSLTDSDCSTLSSIEAIDVAFRSETLDVVTHFNVLNSYELLSSYRVFSIALKLELTDWVDIFVEYHPSSWFIPLKQFIPGLDGILGKQGPKRIQISEDRSAKKVDNHYYIHEGTNKWNRAWLHTVEWSDVWRNQLRTWQNQLLKTENKIKTLAIVDYSLLIVPEKDTIARLENDDFSSSRAVPMVFTQAISNLINKNKFIFPVLELLTNNGQLRYEIPDSHLSAFDYVTMFGLVLDKWGYKNEFESLSFEYSFEPNYGDLGSKFGETTGQRQVVTLPGCADPEVVAGKDEFEIPLRNCFVRWENPEPKIDASVLLLGDSHCSIGGSPFLSFLFSRVFRSVTFMWKPYMLHELELEGHEQFDFVLSEIAQRFVNPTIAN